MNPKKYRELQTTKGVITKNPNRVPAKNSIENPNTKGEADLLSLWVRAGFTNL